MAILNREQAVKLLRTLANDAGFYARFQASPADALQELGLPAAFAKCCAGVKLPPPHVLKASEAALVADLTSHTDLHVIGLNAS